MAISKIGSNALGTGSDTGSITLPSGTTAQRPGSPVEGMIRYNTDNDEVESYSGSSWVSIITATTVDLGNWTITESSGVLYFATGGTNKMKLDASGNLTVTGDVTAYGTV